jgi:glutamine amidotransferase
MCRLAAYAGPPASLSSIMYEAPHSLEKQAYLPREMVSGHVNVDGTGVAWWRDGEAEPLHYVTDRPPWSDANLPRLARRFQGAPILSVVRSQTPGMSAGAAAAHPFVFDCWAGAHNGYLEGFATVAPALIERLDDEVRGQLDALSDSLLLFLLAVTRLRRGASLREALVATAAEAATLCAGIGCAASLNLVLADTGEVAALRAARGVEANSLHTLEDGERWPGGRLIASEALDEDPGWVVVPEDHVVSISADTLTVEAVEV